MTEWVLLECPVVVEVVSLLSSTTTPRMEDRGSSCCCCCCCKTATAAAATLWSLLPEVDGGRPFKVIRRFEGECFRAEATLTILEARSPVKQGKLIVEKMDKKGRDKRGCNRNGEKEREKCWSQSHHSQEWKQEENDNFDLTFDRQRNDEDDDRIHDERRLENAALINCLYPRPNVSPMKLETKVRNLRCGPLISGRSTELVKVTPIKTALLVREE